MRDITIENDSDDTRTHKIFKALEAACLAFDLGKPIWLDSNVSAMCIRDSPYRVGLYQLVPHTRLLGRSGTRLSGGKQGVLLYRNHGY